DPLLGGGNQKPVGVDLKIARPCVQQPPLVISDDKKSIALDGRIQRAATALNGALYELAHYFGRSGSKARLRAGATRSERLGHQIAEGDRAGFETDRVQVRQIISDDVDARCMSVQSCERGGKVGWHRLLSPVAVFIGPMRGFCEWPP